MPGHIVSINDVEKKAGRNIDQIGKEGENMNNKPSNANPAKEQPNESIPWRIGKGIILGAWVVVLLMFAGLAASGNTTKCTGEAFQYALDWVGDWFPDVPRQNDDTFLSSPERRKSENLLPQQLLRQYLSRRYDSPRPPLGALLKEITAENNNWCDVDVAGKYRPASGNTAAEIEQGRNQWVKSQYRELFSTADQEIQAILADKSIDLNNPKGITIQVPSLPALFQGRSGTIKVPRAVTLWVTEQRVRDDQKKQRDELINTFFLLIVLGAFGSLIFLTKEFIEMV